ncbi:MAG: LVIVD repeat-containing protein [Flammeovirgaceae bacterium]
MKLFIRQIALFILFLGALQSCEDHCEETVTYIRYDPIYKGYDAIRAEAGFKTAQDLHHPGKIYLYGQYLLINEINEGIHIFDNSDPSNPQNLGFFNLPGNVDMAVRNNILYADSYIDLVTIDISDITNPSLISRTEEVFPYGYNYLVSEKGIIVDWTETEVTEKRSCSTFADGPQIWLFAEDASAHAVLSSNSSAPKAAPPTTGVGGSMARFTIVNDYLYTVDHSNLRVFDLDQPTQPNNVSNPLIDNWGIETIFPYNGKLFIGSQNGMHIYDLQSPESPTHLSEFEHVTSCDPVVVQGDYAFVTLRGGSNCGGFSNQLDIIDISNPSNPTLYKTYQMQSPFGLGIDGNKLFICEGTHGLKYFDITDLDALSLEQHFTGVDAYDVIPNNDVLIMTGQDGLMQFDYSSANTLTLISTIPVVQTQ